MAKHSNNSVVTIKTKTNLSATSLPPLKPLNPKQAEYINAILHGKERVIIATGVLGSSKTYIPAVIAADKLMRKEIDKIIVARPAEGSGKSIGYFKGGKDEKLLHWCAPITDTLKERLGVGHFEAFLANGRIELLALETVKGRSFNNAYVLVDEVEDMCPAVAKSLVTRQGYNSTTVLSGDLAQKDIVKDSGLDLLLYLAKTYELPVKHIDFDSWEYCVRSEEAKMWGMAFEQFERNSGKRIK
jgi:phosphate starvation-inducible PhoH-like protein